MPKAFVQSCLMNPDTSEPTRTHTGIRYAQAARWEPPSLLPWSPPTGEFPACPQPTDIPLAPPTQSEDCLKLTITTPATPADNRPVLVYIHGGSFNYGAGANYVPKRLAARGDVVAVTINYRLGPFGFLAHPALGPDAGNLGLADQQAALRWIQENITRYGGNPHNVTIMGQSAGGYSVCAHLASPASAGLFHRAIVQSASAEGFLTQAEAEHNARSVTSKLACADIDCLHTISAETLLAASGSGHDQYRPVTGGPLLPVSPAEAFATGHFNKVPILLGGNRDEWTGQLAGREMAGLPPLAPSDYPAAVAASFGASTEAVLAQYPLEAYPSPSEALGAALTDRNWAHPIDKTRRLLAKHTPVYAYEFAERHTPWFPGAPRPSFQVGASHMLELPYLFDVRYLSPAPQEDLSNAMIDHWAHFARTGTPGWPHFSEAKYVQSLASGPNGIHPTSYESDHNLAFWRTQEI
jgi:para-nitrobenzyl esterase